LLLKSPWTYYLPIAWSKINFTHVYNRVLQWWVRVCVGQGSQREPQSGTGGPNGMGWSEQGPEFCHCLWNTGEIPSLLWGSFIHL
jgi:hypothetical protein